MAALVSFKKPVIKMTVEELREAQRLLNGMQIVVQSALVKLDPQQQLPEPRISVSEDGVNHPW